MDFFFKEKKTKGIGRYRSAYHRGDAEPNLAAKPRALHYSDTMTH